MSAILGVFGNPRVHDTLVDMLGRRDTTAATLRRCREVAGAAAIAGTTSDGIDDFGPQVLVRDSLLIAAYASIYYQSDLRRRLERAGENATGDSACELILAAYRAKGAGCADWLEGDFAFAIWDAGKRLLVCASDWLGSRPLYYLRRDDQLAVGTSAADIASHPACDESIDWMSVGVTVASLYNVDPGTGFAGVRHLPAGHTLVWPGNGEPRVVRHWTPPPVEEDRTLGFDAAAEELRRLLTASVQERLDYDAPTAVWLSGGRDSTAIFAAGANAIANGDGRRLFAVSMSYPHGDSGREDEIIDAIVDRWNATIRWCRIDDVPLLGDDAEQCAGSRDVVFSHAYENWNRALARTSRQAGARVVLSGLGGDELFSHSSVYFADLLWRGQWLTFVRDWYLQRGRSVDGLWRLVIRPALPNRVRRFARRFAPNAVAGLYEATIPNWMNPSFVKEHGLDAMERAASPRTPAGHLAAAETSWILTSPHLRAIKAAQSSILVSEGVEVRHPLMDSRVVSFALRRPREERVTRRETKLLLRAAMKGLIPEWILAPRREHTGTIGAYLVTSLRGAARERISAAFKSSQLATAGVVDGAVLNQAWEDFLAGRRNSMDGLRLFATYQAELWARARVGRAPDARGGHSTHQQPTSPAAESRQERRPASWVPSTSIRTSAAARPRG